MSARILFFLLAFLSLSFSAIAQAYEPGLLVRSSGDTLRGEIENGFWTEPPTFIRFRPAPGSPGQLFEPRQLRAVTFTGGRYFRFEGVPIDHLAETRLSMLPRGHTTDVKLDSLLAEVLLDGPATLLRVVRPGSVHYLLQRPGLATLDLCERRFLRENSRGIWEIADGNNFRGQLALAFTDCPTAAEAAKTAPFTAPGLVAVVQAYNQACAPTHQPGRNWLASGARQRPVAFQAGVLLGMRYNRFDYALIDQSSTCVDCQLRPSAGLYADLFLPGRTAAIYGELSMSSFSAKGYEAAGSKQTSSGTFVPVYSYYAYRAWLGTARIGVRYFLPLRHEQQAIIGFNYELNAVLGPTITTTAGPPAAPNVDYLSYPKPTLFPDVSIGWRAQRVTLSLDGQMYIENVNSPIAGSFFGSFYTLRFGLAYRLSGNPDTGKTGPAAKK